MFCTKEWYLLQGKKIIRCKMINTACLRSVMIVASHKYAQTHWNSGNRYSFSHHTYISQSSMKMVEVFFFVHFCFLSFWLIAMNKRLQQGGRINILSGQIFFTLLIHFVFQFTKITLHIFTIAFHSGLNSCNR